MEQRDRRLKLALAEVLDDHDFILIDCPPSLSLLTLNGLTCAHGVIVPMQCEYFALEGLSALVNTIEALKQRLNPSLEIDGIVRVNAAGTLIPQFIYSAAVSGRFTHKGELPSSSASGKSSYSGGGQVNNSQSLSARAAEIIRGVEENQKAAASARKAAFATWRPASVSASW